MAENEQLDYRFDAPRLSARMVVVPLPAPGGRDLPAGGGARSSDRTRGFGRLSRLAFSHCHGRCTMARSEKWFVSPSTTAVSSVTRRSLESRVFLAAQQAFTRRGSSRPSTYAWARVGRGTAGRSLGRHGPGRFPAGPRRQAHRPLRLPSAPGNRAACRIGQVTSPHRDPSCRRLTQPQEPQGDIR
jgi:hypothetical protein